jgi:hypothetical protein
VKAPSRRTNGTSAGTCADAGAVTWRSLARGPARQRHRSPKPVLVSLASRSGSQPGRAPPALRWRASSNSTSGACSTTPAA